MFLYNLFINTNKEKIILLTSSIRFKIYVLFVQNKKNNSK